MTGWRIITGDARDVLVDLVEPGSVHTVITSPPYYGLRDYAVDSQLGLEATPDQYVAGLVDVFRQIRRVLRDDGTVWLNLGDSYAAGKQGRGEGDGSSSRLKNDGRPIIGAREYEVSQPGVARPVPPGCKPKDLLGIPWQVAFALRADGWYLRSDIIWAKPNPMPESVTDRPTKAHEYLFLLSKGPRYYYDADAIREDAIHAGQTVTLGPKSLSKGQATGLGITYEQAGGNAMADSVTVAAARNKRSVWTVATQPYAGAHFATFPPKLIEPCVLAGASERCCAKCGAPFVRKTERIPGQSFDCPKTAMSADARGGRGKTSTVGQSGGSRIESTVRTLGFDPSCICSWDSGVKPGVVLDPFAGAGTTGIVALRHNRAFIGIELNPLYAAMARDRIRDDAPLLNWPLEVAT